MKPDATTPRATDPLIRARAGRDWLRQAGWSATVQILPMPSLMGRRDEGRLTLVGAEVEVSIRPAHHRHAGDPCLWLPRFSFRSDAGEIAERRAAA